MLLFNLYLCLRWHPPWRNSLTDIILYSRFEFKEDEEGTMSVECVGFSKGTFRWAASGGMDKTLKVLCCAVLYCTVLYCTVLYCTALYFIVSYCIISNRTVL